MTNDPQELGEHRTTDEFADLARALRGLSGIGDPTVVAAQDAEHHQVLQDMKRLAEEQPEGYVEQIRRLADTVLNSPTARLDVRANVEVLAGVQLAQGETAEQRSRAIALLTAGLGHALDMPRERRDIDLIVDAGLTLAALHGRIANSSHDPDLLGEPAQHADLARQYIVRVQDLLLTTDDPTRVSYRERIAEVRKVIEG